MRITHLIYNSICLHLFTLQIIRSAYFVPDIIHRALWIIVLTRDPWFFCTRESDILVRVGWAELLDPVPHYSFSHFFPSSRKRNPSGNSNLACSYSSVPPGHPPLVLCSVCSYPSVCSQLS